MRSRWKLLLVFFVLSCTSSKKTSLSEENITEKKRSQLFLPICLNFNPNLPDDTVVNRITSILNDKNIQVITKDKMFDLIQIEMRSVTQNTNISPGSSPESILSQIERKSKAIANHVYIDFSFVDKESNLFKLKWYNQPTPFQLTNYTKPEWAQVDSSLIAKFLWPESLKTAIESIIVSGKLQ